MDIQSLATPLAYTGAALGVTVVIPQLVRTIRHPGMPGVSITSWSLTALGGLTWLLYGVRADLPPQIPGNVLIAAGAVAVVLLVPSTWSTPQRAVLMAAFGVSIIGVSTTLSPQLVGYLGFAITTFSGWPQLVDSYANWRAKRDSAVSLTTWSLCVATAVTWLAYAAIASDIPVLLAAVFGFSAAAAIFCMEASARQAALRREERQLVLT